MRIFADDGLGDEDPWPACDLLRRLGHVYDATDPRVVDVCLTVLDSRTVTREAPWRLQENVAPHQGERMDDDLPSEEDRTRARPSGCHQPGWVTLYEVLERGETPPDALVALCKSSRTGIGETMLHWYAIEGDVRVICRLIELGFQVNVQNDFGNTPLVEAAVCEKWDIVRALLQNGADPWIRDQNGEDFYRRMRECSAELPDDLLRPRPSGGIDFPFPEDRIDSVLAHHRLGVESPLAGRPELPTGNWTVCGIYLDALDLMDLQPLMEPADPASGNFDGEVGTYEFNSVFEASMPTGEGLRDFELDGIRYSYLVLDQFD